MARTLVLASSSRYRATLLRDAGFEFVAIAPDVDERVFDDRFPELGAAGYALELARRKARSVERRARALDPAAAVLAADQVVTLAGELLHQPGGRVRAVAQLCRMSGTTHELLNAVVLRAVDSGDEHHEIDRHTITMRAFSEAEAAAYVERYEPNDSAGGYRLEDDGGLVESVAGEDPSGVIGLPLPTVRRLLERLGRGHLDGNGDG